MSVLSQIQNGSLGKDVRDTFNDLLARLAAAEAQIQQLKNASGTP